MLGHEVDGLGRDLLGGQGEVAFVLAVFVVHQDDLAPLAEFLDGFFDGREWKWHSSILPQVVCLSLTLRGMTSKPPHGRFTGSYRLGRAAQAHSNYHLVLSLALRFFSDPGRIASE